MTDEQKELLKDAGISESDYENCYISADGKIFTPIKDENYNVVVTAEQQYQNYLNPLTPQPTKEELLEKQLLETQATLASLQEQILLNNGGI